jgi:8-oxo-dGTP diphosphatase
LEENPTAIPVVAAALVDPQGRVLLQRRPAGKRHAGLWEFPGGKVEPAESRRVALARELLEELGIEVAMDRLLWVASSTDPGPGHERDPHVLFLYICREWTGQPEAGAGAAIGWFTPNEARVLAVPPLDRPLIDGLEALLAQAGQLQR